MNHNAESASSTELAPLTMEQRAQKALGLVNAKEQLTELAAASAGITEITNKAGYDECHAKRMVLKNKRVEIAEQAEAVRRAAAEEEAAIQAATARQAMEEAVDFLSRLGHADHITTRKLAAVLAKETA